MSKNNRKTAAVYVVFFLSLSLLLSLGGWQWRRGCEKAAIEKVLALNQPAANQHAPNQAPAINRAPPNWSALAYQRVRLQGDWFGARNENKTFFLANRTHRGRPGYEVFSPLQLSGDAATVLVNRGWIPSPQSTTAAPVIIPIPPAQINTPAAAPAAAQITVTGQLYLPQTGFTLGPAYHEPPAGQAPWPKVIQYLDLPALSAALGTPIQPAALALAPDHPAAFTPIWQPYTLTASRHFAYAAQWWGLAATLLVFGFIWRRRG